MKQEFLYLNNAELSQICVGRFSIIFNFNHPWVSISLEEDVFLDGSLVWKCEQIDDVSPNLFKMMECKIQYCAISDGIFFIETSKGKLQVSLNTEGYETGTINSEGRGVYIIGK
jgi:hypothetical protein